MDWLSILIKVLQLIISIISIWRSGGNVAAHAALDKMRKQCASEQDRVLAKRAAHKGGKV